MTVHTTAKTTFKASTAAPATFDKAGYSALTFTSVGEITDYDQFGREFALATHQPVATAGTQKLKASFNEGSMSLTLGLDNEDAGQVLMETAINSYEPVSFEITIQDGTTYYFQGLVMSFKTVLGSVDSVTTATCMIEITTSNTGVGIVKALAE